MKVCETTDRQGNWVVAKENSPFWLERLPTDKIREATLDEEIFFEVTKFSDFNFSDWERFWNE